MRSAPTVHRIAAALALLLLPLCAEAAAGPCTEQFAGGMAPALANARLAQRTTPLCFTAFALLHSGVSRTPLYAAERLTAARITAARGVRRVNLYHPEERLPAEQRAELSDYARSGYDRGHMAPSGDMPDEPSQEEAFSLANMVPQAPKLNRGVWEGIESAVRDLALRDGELYVVTGPMFQGQNLQALKGRVLVPSDTYKAVYDPARHGAAAYVCPNIDRPTCRTVSVSSLQQLTGLDVFPALPFDLKSTAMPLPAAEPYGARVGTARTGRTEPA
jgi:endonuclease G